MRLSDIPIRTKLPFTMAFILLLLAVVMLLFTLILNRSNSEFQELLAREVQIRIESQGILIHTLQARRAEKDFLMRKDPALRPVLAREVDEARKRVATIEELVQNKAEGSSLLEKCKTIIRHLEIYADSFDKMANAQVAMGVDEKSGLQGHFREAAHQVEALLANINGDMGRGYLTMRRHEKDYLLRLEDSYAARVAESLSELRSLGEKWPEGKREDLLRHLDAYGQAFQSLVAQQGLLKKHLETLREAVNGVEPLVEEMDALSATVAQQASHDIQENAARLNRGILYASVLAILVCGLLGMTIVLSLTRSLSDLTRFSREVAAGNLEAHTGVSGRDEVGQLAEVMREVVNATRAIRFIADRMVLIISLMSRGHIPEKIQTPFQGDMKKISEAVNGLIDRLSSLRTIADHLNQLSEGGMPREIQGHFEGDFRRIAEAANRLRNMVGRQVDEEGESGKHASSSMLS